MHIHNHNHSHAGKSGSTLLLTIVFNIVITLAEFIAGIMTGMLALVADATHNLADVASLALAYFGEKSSESAPTKKATYGNKRIEVFTALISSISLLIIAGFILWESYQRFLAPNEITNFPLFLTVAIIGLLGNVASVIILRRENIDSLNRKAAVLHMLTDAASSVAVIVGGVVMHLTGWMILDPILSVLISLLIVWSALGVLRKIWYILMEVAPDHIVFDDVKATLEKHSKVQNVHDLHIWSLSSTETALSCHVCVTAEDLVEVDSIIHDLNQVLESRFKISHTTIQIETGVCARPAEVCSGAVTPTAAQNVEKT